MRYGEMPKTLGQYKVDCKEMMFYQDMPVKMKDGLIVWLEPRLFCFEEIVRACYADYIEDFGKEKYKSCYMYVSAKYLFQPKGHSFNRPGWHCDGFMTDDINYIWSDYYPTIFNDSEFNLTMDDRLSLNEMAEQANPLRNRIHDLGMLLRLNQYNVHKVAEVTQAGMRTFLKVSFSKDRYDLIGNSHNYNFSYEWPMKPRAIERNIPQSSLKI